MSYSQHDQERFLDEPAKRAGRTEFMRDRARVIHSAALRRLAAKTQVAVPWENDFQRTRLSHSLECAQIGRELGESLGADPDLQDTACLAHDLGHPPFGHNGEEALASIAADFGGFEGNAQSFRLLVRATQQEAIDAHKRLSALSAWPHYYDGTHRSLARLKDSTSQLIGRFVLAAELETRKIHGDGALSRYRADLEIPREQIIEVDFLKAIAGHYLINAAHSQDRYAKQQLIVSELVEMLRARAPQELDSFFLKSWNQASDEIARMRVIIDQVAALTDPGAYALHARLLASR
ncbi:MAG: dNTP triphosphohydrolase [Actinobacteria bacterium]|nr:dNTP triphosphohydrolase [Actinomycetota bacterium]